MFITIFNLVYVQGRRDNKLDKPNGVAVGREGQIYIADREIVAFKFNIQCLPHILVH